MCTLLMINKCLVRYCKEHAYLSTEGAHRLSARGTKTHIKCIQCWSRRQFASSDCSFCSMILLIIPLFEFSGMLMLTSKKYYNRDHLECPVFQTYASVCLCILLVNSTRQKAAHLVFADQFDVVLVRQELGHNPFLLLFLRSGDRLTWRPPGSIAYEQHQASI